MPPPRQQATGRPPPVRVERIATAPMSRQQREQAVAALAVLITAWRHGPSGVPDDDPARPDRFPFAA
jgi:hypothetical protein